MTTPTQAQIEAATTAFYGFDGITRLEVRMEAALTAAAQVGEPNQKHLASYIRTIGKSIEDRTIERCARVAEQMTATTEFWRDDVAAAIRKLKEQP